MPNHAIITATGTLHACTEEKIMKPNAESCDDAKKAFESGDYETAIKILQPLAGQGNAGAQNNLGDMYFYGQGVMHDYAEAAKWFRKAAGQGDAKAQNRLGDRYYFGQGVACDYAEAVKWFRKAAEQGNAEACCNLGFMYSSGRGVPLDDAEAVLWYRKVAERGWVKASTRHGMVDLVQAYLWYAIAVAHSSDKGNRANSEQARNKVAKLMTAAQLAKAKTLAREWKPVPANADPSR
jgi:hypothetical protein